MFTNLSLLTLAFLSTATVRDPRLYRPRIELWTNKGDAAVYSRGDRVRVFFRLDQDAYVTIFRVDTDGRVRVLFPRDPWEDNFARGGADLEVDGRELRSDAFAIDDYAGVGYLFAVASADPFVYDQIESGDHCGLLERSVRRLLEKRPDMRADETEVREHLGVIHRMFFDHQAGAPLPVA
jgi:hypothetical protein